MNIYKTNYPTEQEGIDYLIDKGVWQEVTEEGVTSMQYINGTQAVVNIGKVVEFPATFDDEGHELTPPIYYDGWAYDIMSSDTLDFGSDEVYPADKAAHSFYGWARDAEVPPKETIINTKLDPEVKIIVDVEDKAKAIIEE
jgi:hypothetical protein